MGVVARTSWDGPAIEAKTYDAVEKALLAAGSVVQVQMRTNISAAKGPSTPGQFPGWQTRTLANSVTVERMTPNRVRMGSKVFYGKYLEYGVPPYGVKTHGGGHPGMAARPWVVRSFFMAKDRAKARFDETMRAMLGGNGGGAP